MADQLTLEATMRRMYELLTAGDIDGFGELLAADFMEHEVIPGLEPTREGVKQLFRTYRAAFPDMRLDVADVIVGGDKAVARVTFSGTNRGEMLGMPATGKHAEAQLIDIMRFGADGLVHEHWGVFDLMALMQQLGAAPAGPSA